MHDQIPPALDQATATVAATLHWPGNLGIQLRSVRLHTRPRTDLLAVFVHGVADEDLVRVLAIEPLERAAMQQPDLGPLLPAKLSGLLPAPRLSTVTEFSAAITGILNGATALFFDGAAEAALVETRGPATRPLGGLAPENAHKAVFGPHLPDNVALIRQRLRDPALVAEPEALPRGRGAAAVVYLKGRAAPELVRQIRQWLQRHAGEEALRRGLTAGPAGMLGGLPEVMACPWPDKAAALLDAGHAVVLLDRLRLAYVAPVTLPAVLYSPGDDLLTRPLGAVLRLVRVALAGLTVLAPGTLVAVINYHPEMIPTPFALGLAAARENLPFPLIFAVLGLELLQELIREASFRLPLRISPGQALLGGLVLIFIMVQGGLVDAAPAVVSAMVAFASLALPSYELVYLARTWRFWVIAGAALFGFVGMAAGAFVLLVYLSRAQSFGVPFWSETGVRFTAPGRVAGQRKGGERDASGHVLR